MPPAPAAVTDRPSFITLKTIIGWPAPNKTDTASAHGEPLGEDADILAGGKHVVVIGGGDTGSDCVGTSNRQGARSVTQIEIMPKPPEKEDKQLTWPDWPMKLRTSSSHEEGALRDWAVLTKEVVGENDSEHGCADRHGANLHFERRGRGAERELMHHAPLLHERHAVAGRLDGPPTARRPSAAVGCRPAAARRRRGRPRPRRDRRVRAHPLARPRASD